ncbi:MAG TPA: class I SAM-dependent methyltransferase [Vicinamibacterales bacterium]|nr:class I SAM-dependent methyltransferase [Vicinamibacterales bacterium]
MIETTDLMQAAAGDVLTQRVRATWTDGDFGRIAPSFENGAATFITRLGLTGRDDVLDVACGTGNTALPAARTGARVTAIDIAPNLLEQLGSRAVREALALDIHEGNCEALPFEGDRFDTVITMYGAMFAARPERAAAELLRVCRAGGKVAMANWTRTGFIGKMLKTTVAFVPAPSDVPSPLLWGDPEVVQERLAGAASLTVNRRMMPFQFPVSPSGVVQLFRDYYGPTKRAFERLDVAQQAAFHASLTELWSEHNQATDGSTYVESEYLEVVAIKG